MIRPNPNPHQNFLRRVSLILIPVITVLIVFFVTSLIIGHHPPIRTVVQATRNLQANVPLTEHDLEVVFRRFEDGQLPVTDVEHAIGSTPRHSITAGEILLHEDLLQKTQRDSNAPSYSNEKSSSESRLHNTQTGNLNKDIGCPDLDDALNNALIPLKKQLSSILEELNQNSGDKHCSNSLSDSCQAFGDLLSRLPISSIGPEGKTTLMDLIGKGFDIGDKILESGTESQHVFLDQFLGEFLKEFGGTLGEGTGQAITELGNFVYKKLTSEEQPTGNTWIVRFHAIGSYDGPTIQQQLSDVVNAAKAQGYDHDCTIQVSGHTDTLGGDHLNRQLAEHRAKTVADKISTEFPDLTINYDGWGERRLKRMTGDSVADMLNRRVEIKFICNR